MKNIEKLKKVSLLIFLAAIIPFGKLEMFNGVIIVVNLFSVFTKNAMSVMDYLMLFLCLLGVYLVFLRKSYSIIFGFILTFIWLIYEVPLSRFIGSLIIIISMTLYLIVSVYTSFRIIKFKTE